MHFDGPVGIGQTKEEGRNIRDEGDNISTGKVV